MRRRWPSVRELLRGRATAAGPDLGAFVDAAFQPLLAVSRDGTIQRANQRIAEMFGYEASELVGRNLEMLLPERFRGRLVGYLKAYFAEPAERPMGSGRDLAGLRKDGTEFPAEVG